MNDYTCLKRRNITIIVPRKYAILIEKLYKIRPKSYGGREFEIILGFDSKFDELFDWMLKNGCILKLYFDGVLLENIHEELHIWIESVKKYNSRNCI